MKIEVASYVQNEEQRQGLFILRCVSLLRTNLFAKLQVSVERLNTAAHFTRNAVASMERDVQQEV